MIKRLFPASVPILLVILCASLLFVSPSSGFMSGQFREVMAAPRRTLAPRPPLPPAGEGEVLRASPWLKNPLLPRAGEGLGMRVRCPAPAPALTLTSGTLDARGELTPKREPFTVQDNPKPQNCPLLNPLGQASRVGYAQASRISHGIQLVVSLPRASYPWNALAAVTVRATNVSSHVIGIAPTGVPYSCFIDAPVIVVQRKDGGTAFPPANPGEPGPPCAPPFIDHPRELPPGKSIIVRQHVILRAAHVRAYLNLAIGGRSVKLTTPLLSLHLFSSPAAQATLHLGSPVFATALPPPGARGAVLKAEWWHCRGRALVGAPGYMTIEEAQGPFRPVNPRRIRPQFVAGCNRLLEWHAAVGWLNHPVANIDYVRP